MELWEDFIVHLNVDDVLRGEGVNTDSVSKLNPALVKLASFALSEGLQMVHPAAIVNSTSVIEHRHDSILLESSHKLTGRLVSRHLSGAVQIVAVVCTIGGELEKFLESKFATDPSYAIALDGLGNAAVENVAQQVCERVGDQASARSLTASTLISPGESGWSVEVGQPQIFDLLDLSIIRVELTSAGMMIPRKSLSFIVGIGPDMTQTDSCQLCNIRESCRYRHV